MARPRATKAHVFVGANATQRPISEDYGDKLVDAMKKIGHDYFVHTVPSALPRRRRVFSHAMLVSPHYLPAMVSAEGFSMGIPTSSIINRYDRRFRTPHMASLPVDDADGVLEEAYFRANGSPPLAAVGAQTYLAFLNKMESFSGKLVDGEYNLLGIWMDPTNLTLFVAPLLDESYFRQMHGEASLLRGRRTVIMHPLDHIEGRILDPLSENPSLELTVHTQSDRPHSLACTKSDLVNVAEQYQQDAAVYH